MKKKLSIVKNLLPAILMASVVVASVGYGMPKLLATTETPQEAGRQIGHANIEKKILEEKGTVSIGNLVEEVNLEGLRDGVYIGQGKGYNGLVKVSVTIQDKKIFAIEVIHNGGDDEPYFAKAKTLIAEILRKQTSKVDTVSGATFISNGIIGAVRNALAQATSVPISQEAPMDAPTQGPETMIDLIAPTKGSEVFLGKGRGYRYLSGQSAGADQDSLNQAYILVAVEVKDKQVKNIQVVQHKEDTPYIKKANPFLVKQVLKDKGLEESKRSIEEKSGVIYDTVSGATLSSNGILEGIEEAIKEARLRGSLGKDFGEIKDPAEKPPTPPVPPTPIIPPTPPVPPTPIIPPTPPVPPAPIIPPTPPVPPTSEYQSYFGLGKGYRYEEGQKQGKSPEELLSTLLKVEVVVKDKKIEKIQVVTHQEDKLYMKMVNPYLVNKMKETEAIEGIAKEVSEKKGTHYDQISGATKSGNAISQATVAAVKEAIKAGALENGYGGVMK